MEKPSASCARRPAPCLERHGLTLGIENHDRFLAHEYAEMIAQIGHPLVGTVVDSTNSLSTEEPIDEVLQYMEPYCVCFHVKDYTIQRSNRRRAGHHGHARRAGA